MPARLIVSGVSKSFVMHLRGGVQIPVISGVSFSLDAGECVVLGGPSGIGKSSILKMVYGNYGVDSGQIIAVRPDGKMTDIASANARTIHALRRSTIGYVSQFLRAVPRVSARDVVAEPLAGQGIAREEALGRAEELLEKLNLPKALWDLPPATFSGGEQQRVNIARGFITSHPVLLLDEPTASLDAQNRQVVVDLIRDKKAAGTAMLGIFHDQDVRDAVADRIVDVARFSGRGEAAA
ncbi:phosphonate C-P lyase system protein PhnL [Roseibium litorale]|uniref:Phosphonate C-P lyase system protein PhnL n=1 Tax=Roseibium litorale TaxID=2803841 RepID=A0ABR9CSC7_9HYPH|nr:phosphonate C-P lyase system protein PhnL [Roseibium litorale]MBD8893608.1 phosphonate C-P lyase system protein PhnL [Roseibium litorale]